MSESPCKTYKVFLDRALTATKVREVYRTLWAGRRAKWIADFYWKATLVLEIDEELLTRIADRAAKDKNKRAQHGPLRVSLEDFEEREVV